MPDKKKEISVATATEDETCGTAPAPRREKVKRFRKISMVTKMIGLMTALMLVASLAYYLLTYREAGKAIEDIILISGEQLVGSMADSITTEMYNMRDETQRQQSISNLTLIMKKRLAGKGSQGIEDAYILNKDFSILVAKEGWKQGGTYENPDPLKELAGVQTIYSDAHISTVASPVQYSKITMGFVVMTFNKNAAEQARRRIMMMFLFIFGVIFIGMVIILRFTLRHQLKPIVNLGRASDEFAKGNYDFDLAEAPGNDEVATTIRSFKRMMQDFRVIARFSNRVLVNKIRRGEMAEKAEEINLTVCFMDGVGFTNWSAAHTAPKIADHLTDYFTLSGRLMDQMGGLIDKTIGDAILAYFGVDEKESKAPAQNAIRAMFAIQYMVSFANYAFHTFHGRLPLDFRIGVAAGRCVLGAIGVKGVRMDFTIASVVANLAQRLESMAEPGGLLIDSYTYLNSGGESYLVVEGPTLVRPKGFKQKVPAYKVITYKAKEDKEAFCRDLTACALSTEVREVLSLTEEDWQKYADHVRECLNDNEPRMPFRYSAD
ncbi:HAMP domain-containing protein [Patescibacteria group bacterium]|nr:HAMP domain-containing protein [Patescibacteria group bacterium]